ncbi:hypothetical protein [Nostoc sp.]
MVYPPNVGARSARRGPTIGGVQVCLKVCRTNCTGAPRSKLWLAIASRVPDHKMSTLWHQVRMNLECIGLA